MTSENISGEYLKTTGYKFRRGDPQVLPTVPWEVVEAIQSNGYLLFE